MQDSRNNISVHPEIEGLKIAIKSQGLSKRDKQLLLSRLRSVEKQLGIEGTNYNSSEF